MTRKKRKMHEMTRKISTMWVYAIHTTSHEITCVYRDRPKDERGKKGPKGVKSNHLALKLPNSLSQPHKNWLNPNIQTSPNPQTGKFNRLVPGKSLDAEGCPNPRFMKSARDLKALSADLESLLGAQVSDLKD